MYANIVEIEVELASSNGTSVTVNDSRITSSHVVIEDVFPYKSGRAYPNASVSYSPNGYTTSLLPNATYNIGYTVASAIGEDKLLAFRFQDPYNVYQIDSPSGITIGTKYTDLSMIGLTSAGGANTSTITVRNISDSAVNMRSKPLYLSITKTQSITFNETETKVLNWSTSDGSVTFTGTLLKTLLPDYKYKPAVLKFSLGVKQE